MTLNELEKKYKGYDVIYYGKSDFTKTLKDCKGHTPYTFMGKVKARDHGKLQVIEYEVVDKEIESIGLALTSKGLIGTGVTKYKGTVYALLDTDSLKEKV